MDDSKDSNSPTKEIVKHPFRILKIAIDRIVKLAIPLHLETLQNQCENIKTHRENADWNLLHNEQVNASNTVRLLKSDIHELEGLNAQVKDEDRDQFLKEIHSPTQKVVDALVTFLASNFDVMSPLPQFEDSTSAVDDIPKLICDLSKKANDDDDTINDPSDALMQIQVYKKPIGVSKHWEKLKNDIIELNELFKRFANSVFGQKESIDTIENQVQKASENVLRGTKHLNKAVVLQATLIPVAGAAIGGLLGPIGAIVGFKLAGSLACALSGSVMGYGIGRKIKNQRIASCDMEMRAIAASSARLSSSTPDLSDTANPCETSSGHETDSKKDQ